MTAEEKKIAQALAEKYEDFTPGIIAIRRDGQAGFALVAPNSTIESFVLLDGALIADCYLN